MNPPLPELLNLFSPLPAPAEGEHFQVLLETGMLRIERIVSDGQVSPPGFWYDQPHDEWVLLLQGAAVLAFAEGERVLGAGDSLLIPAHCRHRVAHTAPRSVWLALHILAGGD